MRKRVLAVDDLRPGVLEQRLGPAAPFDRDHRVEGAVADRSLRQLTLEIELEAVNGRDEAAERDQGGGLGASGSEFRHIRAPACCEKASKV